jgi:hypothetical protein
VIETGRASKVLLKALRPVDGHCSARYFTVIETHSQVVPRPGSLNLVTQTLSEGVWIMTPTVPHTCFGRFTALCATLCLAATSIAGELPDPISVHYELPSLDRWNYPFNQTPGTRANASIFAPYIGEHLSPDFDNRHAQFHIAFSTASDIPTGLGAETYHVTQATITVQVSNHNEFRYDPSYDPWQTYLPTDHPEYFADTSTGRPIEIYGVGFRYGYDALSYQENTPFVPSGFGIGKYIRTTFALEVDDDGKPRDVSNNVDEGFDPHLFAIGTTSTVNPGSLVPATTIFTFELDLEDPFVQQYLGEQLDLGKLPSCSRRFTQAAKIRRAASPISIRSNTRSSSRASGRGTTPRASRLARRW